MEQDEAFINKKLIGTDIVQELDFSASDVEM